MRGGESVCDRERGERSQKETRMVMLKDFFILRFDDPMDKNQHS